MKYLCHSVTGAAIGVGGGGELTTDNYLDNSPGTEHSAQVARTIISGVDFANVCG